MITIAAERTFWEKATILHKEAQRPGALPERHSRHYYGLHMLAHSPVRARALSDLSLLADVVAFKQRFYPSRWARYDLATPGTFKLLPADAARIENLERDYANMQVMLFGGPPAFAAILETLRDLELEINSVRPRVG